MSGRVPVGGKYGRTVKAMFFMVCACWFVVLSVEAFSRPDFELGFYRVAVVCACHKWFREVVS